MAELLGIKAITERKRLWSAKRVFYCTPQVLDNDLKNGIVDIKRITCVVVDECHRAQGDYVYTTLLNNCVLSINLFAYWFYPLPPEPIWRKFKKPF